MACSQPQLPETVSDVLPLAESGSCRRDQFRKFRRSSQDPSPQPRPSATIFAGQVEHEAEHAEDPEHGPENKVKLG